MLEQDAPLPITRGLHTEWLARADLRQTIDLCSKAGREALAVWWFTASKEDRVLCSLVMQGALDEISISLRQGAGCSITRRERLLWCSRADLRGAFDILTDEGLQAYLQWLSIDGVNERVLHCEIEIASLAEASDRSAGVIGYAEGGVNIIGYGRGEFGIGEDVRMAVRALSSVDVELCVPLIPLRVAARQDDSTLRAHEVPQPVYQTNLVCLPHYETLRLLAASGHSILDQRYNIGFWQWELPQFPVLMTCALDLVDEIWSASSFTADAMRAVTDKPVLHMPMVVTLPEPIRKWARRDFSLPEEDFIYITVLDGNSSLKRKNPLTTVRAFLAAFPAGKGVRLIVKAMNVNTLQTDWRSIVELASKDERVSLIVETMTKDKLLGLQSVCDCFVSLHRSEGFGRNIAEAMLLGKPVIVSDYSGNKDFTTEQTAFLVSGSVIPLASGDYPFADGQSWFEPEQEVASETIRACLELPNVRKRKALAGQALVLENYSTTRVGLAYQIRLESLRKDTVHRIDDL